MVPATAWEETLITVVTGGGETRWAVVTGGGGTRWAVVTGGGETGCSNRWRRDQMMEIED